MIGTGKTRDDRFRYLANCIRVVERQLAEDAKPGSSFERDLIQEAWLYRDAAWRLYPDLAQREGLTPASAMSAGTAETPQEAQGQRPASAVPASQGDAQNLDPEKGPSHE